MHMIDGESEKFQDKEKEYSDTITIMTCQKT